MARPTVEDSKLRKFVVSTKVTGEDLKLIKQTANGLGLKQAAYLYDRIINNSTSVKKQYVLPQEQLKNLMNIGSNLNQIARVLNTVSNPHLSTEDKLRIKAAHETLNKIIAMVSFKNI